MRTGPCRKERRPRQTHASSPSRGMSDTSLRVQQPDSGALQDLALGMRCGAREHHCQQAVPLAPQPSPSRTPRHFSLTRKSSRALHRNEEGGVRKMLVSSPYAAHGTPPVLVPTWERKDWARPAWGSPIPAIARHSRASQVVHSDGYPPQAEFGGGRWMEAQQAPHPVRNSVRPVESGGATSASHFSCVAHTHASRPDVPQLVTRS